MIDQIKTIIESLGLSYFRSINTKDLNEQAIKNSMENIGVHAGLISIEAEFSEVNNRVFEAWDITILFLTLAPSIDTPAIEIDIVLEVLRVKAYEFLAKMQEEIPLGYYLESYELSSTDSINITNEVLIGWELKFKAPQIRNICL